MRSIKKAFTTRPFSTIWLMILGAKDGAIVGFVGASIAICGKAVHQGAPSDILLEGDINPIFSNITTRIVQDEYDTYNHCKVILFSTAAGACAGAFVGLRRSVKEAEEEQKYDLPYFSVNS